MYGHLTTPSFNTSQDAVSHWRSVRENMKRAGDDAGYQHASDELKAIYLEKMISGEWTGTMNLTEPQAGSDLALIRSRAEPQADGSYKVFGQKIFITYGDHDMTENIVHLVLVRKRTLLARLLMFYVDISGFGFRLSECQCFTVDHPHDNRRRVVSVLASALDRKRHSIALPCRQGGCCHP
jgi:alkylation response protein AidB-like acyl-CoA dehydrogenase